MRSLTNIRRMIFGVVIICFLGSLAFGAPRRYIISGFVQTSGGSGAEGVSVVGDNGAGSAVTDANGAYSITVPNNWGGTITVSKAGWLITPPSKTYNRIRENKANENYIAYQPKISGNVFSNEGLAISGATISASGGFSAISDSDGYYELMVPYGWNGSINVTATGYYFGYTTYLGTVVSDRPNVNFTGFRPKISGSVKDAAGFYLHDVVITADNGGGSKIAILGSYEIFVPYGWSGTLTASLTGYGFTEKSYTNVTTNQVNQNFTGYQPKISGYVKKADGTALSGATVSASGAASTTTNATGYYEVFVPYGWSGTVTASKAGYSFTAKSYTNVTTNQVNQNFTGYQPKISGYVKKADGTAVSGATVSANGGASTTTNASGYYEIVVPYDWSGTVTPNRLGWGFTPSNRNYSNVTADQVDQDFTAVYVGIIVKPDGTGDFATIQAAINAAVNGDVVILQAGTYTGSGNRDIHFWGKAITVRGATGEPNDCVIDCQGNQANPHRGFTFSYDEDNNSVLEAITITNGYGHKVTDGYYEYSRGGAVYCTYSSPTISNCIIRNNSGTEQGAGIFNNYSSPSINNCIFINNSASRGGGGIDNYRSSPTLFNCTFSYNSALYSGGAIHNRDSFPIIRNCIINNNSATSPGGSGGGGISNNDSSPSIINCSIINNSASYNGSGVYDFSSSYSSINNCIIWGNQPTQIRAKGTVRYCDIQNGYTGVGNIDADPCFVDNYHLSAYSPCIDAGDPNYVAGPNETDIDGDPRVIIRIDMGSDEFFAHDSGALFITTQYYEFQALGIDSNTPLQSLSINNYGELELNWQIEIPDDCSWLSVSTLSGQTASLETSEVSISIDHNNIDYGTFSCQLTISDANAQNSPQFVTVNLEVLGPQIGVNNTNFYFTAYGKSDTSVAGQELVITNTGFDTLNWHIEIPNDCNWLSVFPSVGQVNTGESNDVEITVNPNIAGYGTNSCQLQVTSPDAQNSPQVVTVNLEVLGPELAVSPSQFYFETALDEPNTAGQILFIQNTGYDSLNWNIEMANDCDWLKASHLAGQAGHMETDEVILSIDHNNIDYGTYSCQFQIVAPNAVNSPQAVTVNLDVLSPELTVSPSQFYFETALDEPNTTGQILSIQNAGYDTLYWDIYIPAKYNWLNASEISGQSTGELDEVILSIDHNEVEAGFYEFDITVSDPNADNSPQMISVEVHVLSHKGQRHVPSEYDTIQAAIDAAVDGDEVIIHPGVYTGQGNFDIDFKGKALTVRSINPHNPVVVAATIIDADNNPAAAGFDFHTGEDPNSVVDGLTITRCGWGAVSCYQSSPTIRNCIIRNNCSTPEGGGAAIACGDSSAIITNCIIKENKGGEEGGSGILLWKANVTITNCLVTDNWSWGGGGISCYDSDALIRNCTFTGSDYGSFSAGIFISYSSYVTINNCILWSSNSNDGPKITIEDYSGLFPSTVTVSYSDVQGGPDAVYVDPTCTLNLGMGNIDVNPHFVEGDFHLQSQAGRSNPHVYLDIDLFGDGIINLLDFGVLAGSWQQTGVNLPADFDNSGVVDFSDLVHLLDNYLTTYTPGAWVFDDVNTSPCIDAGDPNSDWTQELWPHGKRINMGAFGGTPEASMSLSNLGNVADFNLDDVVDWQDLIILLDMWLAQDPLLAEDIDRNGFVNFTDYAEFTQNWLWEE